MAARRALAAAFGSIGQSAQNFARGLEPQVRRKASGQAPGGPSTPGSLDWFEELMKRLGIQPPEPMTTTAPPPNESEG